MSDSPPPSLKMEMDLLAEKIRRAISAAGVCEIHGLDLAPLWVSTDEIPDSEKRLRIENFAHQYGFRCVIDYGLACAIFR